VYHRTVRRIARRNFEKVAAKDDGPLLASCAPDVRHRFGGDHALGGVRNGRDALRRWFGRLGRLAPSLRLTVHEVWVTGPPWQTVVVVRWSATQDLPDGSPYLNRGVHVVELRWDTVTSIDANEDSQEVARSLRVWAEAGVEEATAAPITS